MSSRGFVVEVRPCLLQRTQGNLDSLSTKYVSIHCFEDCVPYEIAKYGFDVCVCVRVCVCFVFSDLASFSVSENACCSNFYAILFADFKLDYLDSKLHARASRRECQGR